jgi:two-component system, OmpR family, response regulator
MTNFRAKPGDFIFPSCAIRQFTGCAKYAILVKETSRHIAKSELSYMRVLVVEDEPELLCTISQTLREEGYAVDTAEDGEDGISKAEGLDYDVILLDVLIPQLDGWELLQRLRKTKKTPVLMLTARDALRDRVRGLNGGADDYLTKPFEFDELVARIKALIRRSAGQAVPQIEVGQVRIDTTARKVFRDGKVVILTAREYSLLEFLALHRGKVVTRTMLYDHLLGEEDDSLSNLMDVYVGNIRRKLGHDLIITRRGHGYCVE